jgi:hypothetical protein
MGGRGEERVYHSFETGLRGLGPHFDVSRSILSVASHLPLDCDLLLHFLARGMRVSIKSTLWISLDAAKAGLHTICFSALAQCICLIHVINY